MNRVEPEADNIKPFRQFKIADCSKRELLRRLEAQVIAYEQLRTKILNVATGFQAMACELRTVDKDNKIFDPAEGVMAENQVSVVDNFLENGEYVQYREKRREERADNV